MIRRTTTRTERYAGYILKTESANKAVSLQSEKLIGAWMKARGNRDEIVIATKYTIAYKNIDPAVKLKVCCAPLSVLPCPRVDRAATRSITKAITRRACSSLYWTAFKSSRLTTSISSTCICTSRLMFLFIVPHWLIFYSQLGLFDLHSGGHASLERARASEQGALSRRL